VLATVLAVSPPLALAGVLAGALAGALAGCSAPAADLRAVAAEAFADCPSGGVVLVARGREPVLREAFGLADVALQVPMQPGHVLATGSITKQFTAAAVLRLAAQGRLSLDDDVRTWVPELQTGGRAITIEHVLTHTSGLPNLVDREDFDELAVRAHEPLALLGLTADAPLHFEPGRGFRYSDTGYILLGLVIERASGESYAEYVEQRLARPLGLADTWCADDARLVPRRAPGHSVADGAVVPPARMSMSVPYAAGNLLSTADDLLRWTLALHGGEVVPPELLARALSPRTLPDGTPVGYGFGVQLCRLSGRPTVEHGGFVNGYGAAVLHVTRAGAPPGGGPDVDLDDDFSADRDAGVDADLDESLTVVVLVNNDADRPDAGALARRLARAALTGSPDIAPMVLGLPQRIALVGRYDFGGGLVRAVSERGGQLHVQTGDGPARPLVPIERWRFTPADGDEGLLYTFEPGPAGTAQRLHLSLRCEPLGTGTRLGAEEAAGRAP
jgi:CubicO group peptidase (beta-lactamase class C family)